MTYEITPAELQALAGTPMLLIDCREPGEWDLVRLAGAELIPMGTIPAEIQRIEAAADDKPVIVYCHHGVRSLQVVAWLRRQGVEDCRSLAGGIDRWSLEIDSTLPRY